MAAADAIGQPLVAAKLFFRTLPGSRKNILDDAGNLQLDDAGNLQPAPAKRHLTRMANLGTRPSRTETVV